MTRIQLHRTTTKALLHALRQEKLVLSLPLPAARYALLRKVAAMDGDTPEEAVRKLIVSFCAEFDYGTRTNPRGAWQTEPRPPKSPGAND